MENFIIALNAVVPLFCLMLIGVLIRQARLLSAEGFNFSVRLCAVASFTMAQQQLDSDVELADNHCYGCYPEWVLAYKIYRNR
jgi:hypothetical protein